MLKKQQNRENYYFQNADKTNEEKIIDKLNIIESKLDQILNDSVRINWDMKLIPYQKDLIRSHNKICKLSSSETDCEILTLNENGELV